MLYFKIYQFFLGGSGEFDLHANGIPLYFDFLQCKDTISVKYHGQVMKCLF